MSKAIDTAVTASPQPLETSERVGNVVLGADLVTTPGMTTKPRSDVKASDDASRSIGVGANTTDVRSLLPKAVLAGKKVDVGEDLESLLRTSGSMNPREALRYLTALISVLEALHRGGQVHGNLAPDLLFVAKGEDGSPRLRLLKGRERRPSAQDGPAAALAGRMLIYSSPEQIEGSTPSFASDLYALGLIAYTLLVGEPYWAEEVDRLGFMAFCRAIVDGLPEAPSARALRRKNIRLPQDFDAWFVLVTSRKHPDRFQDIEDAGAALTSVLSNPDLRELSRSFQFKFNPSILQAPAQNNPPPAENLRRTALVAILASVAIGVAIVMALRWTHAQQQTQHDPSTP